MGGENPEVVGSNPAPATNFQALIGSPVRVIFRFHPPVFSRRGRTYAQQARFSLLVPRNWQNVAVMHFLLSRIGGVAQ